MTFGATHHPLPFGHFADGRGKQFSSRDVISFRICGPKLHWSISCRGLDLVKGSHGLASFSARQAIHQIRQCTLLPADALLEAVAVRRDYRERSPEWMYRNSVLSRRTVELEYCRRPKVDGDELESLLGSGSVSELSDRLASCLLTDDKRLPNRCMQFMYPHLCNDWELFVTFGKHLNHDPEWRPLMGMVLDAYLRRCPVQDQSEPEYSIKVEGSVFANAFAAQYRKEHQPNQSIFIDEFSLEFLEQSHGCVRQRLLVASVLLAGGSDDELYTAGTLLQSLFETTAVDLGFLKALADKRIAATAGSNTDTERLKLTFSLHL